MAFSTTVVSQYSDGDKTIVEGTFTNGGGDTGGTIKTGLSVVEFVRARHSGDTIIDDCPAVTITIPQNSGDVVVVTTDGADGWFQITGY